VSSRATSVAEKRSLPRSHQTRRQESHASIEVVKRQRTEPAWPSTTARSWNPASAPFRDLAQSAEPETCSKPGCGTDKNKQRKNNKWSSTYRVDELLHARQELDGLSARHGRPRRQSLIVRKTRGDECNRMAWQQLGASPQTAHTHRTTAATGQYRELAPLKLQMGERAEQAATRPTTGETGNGPRP
jgi:hypothetical protein